MGHKASVRAASEAVTKGDTIMAKRQCRTAGCRQQRAKFKAAASSCRNVIVSEIRGGAGWKASHKAFGSCMRGELRKRR
jgi:hypothetical protein